MIVFHRALHDRHSDLIAENWVEMTAFMNQVPFLFLLVFRGKVEFLTLFKLEVVQKHILLVTIHILMTTM